MRAFLRRFRRTGTQAAPTAEARPAPVTGSGPVEKILRSGIFDQEYYELQTGTRFASLGAAVRDYQRQGRKDGLSPHPLFETEWFHSEKPVYRSASLANYFEDRGRTTGAGPLFDDAVYRARFPESVAHPGRELGHFVEHAADDDPLPTTARILGRAPTWREAREIAYAAAREYRRYEDLRHTPRRGPWNEEADAAFVATWSQHPAATAGTGPAVTVVMPVRNRPVQVVEAIASIQAQSLTDWELVVVDDGSTDDTPTVLARIAEADPRVRVVTLPPSGVSGARNAGIDAATGRWLAFLDSDNTWVPHFLGVMVAYLEANDLGAGHAVVDSMVEPVDELSGRYLNLDADLDHLLVRNHIDLNALVVRTATAREAGSFDPALRRWVDHDFAIRVARRTPIPLVPFVGVRYDHSHEAIDRITTTESSRWEWIVLAKGHLDWDAPAPARVPDRVSVCIPTAHDWKRTRVAIDAVLRAGAPEGVDLEVVVLLNGTRRSRGAVLHALYDADPRVRITSVPRNLGFGIGASRAFLASTGETVVFLDNDTEVLAGWLEPLLTELGDADVLGVQSLLLNPDGSIWSAGLAFARGASIPFRLLAGHPVDDARRLGPLRRRVVSANALAMRAADVTALRGFDPAYVNGLDGADLCLRAGAGGERTFTVRPDSQVVHHQRIEERDERIEQENRHTFADRWAGALPTDDLAVIGELGLQVAHLDPGEPVELAGDLREPRPVVVRPRSVVGDGPGAGRPALRWSIKTSVPLREPDPAGHPELAAAEAIAAALRTLGQDVVVDRLEANQRLGDYLDDVTVTLRGGTALVVAPGRPNLLWLLGPAADVPTDELDRYDAVLGGTPDLDPVVAAQQLLDEAVSRT